MKESGKDIWRSAIPLVLLAWLISPSSARAQALGLPLLSEGTGKVMFAVAGGQQDRVVGGWPTRSRLAYGRAALGIAGRMDLFVSAGVVELRIQSPEPGISDLTSSPALAYGLGMNLRLIQLRRIGLSLVATANLWRFQSTPTGRLLQQSQSGFDRRAALHYDWREASGAAAIRKTLGPAKIYLALGGYMIQRREQSWQILNTPVGDIEGNRATGEFRSGLVPQLFSGIDFILPQGFKLSVELQGSDRRNFGVLVGVSQTGSPP